MENRLPAQAAGGDRLMNPDPKKCPAQEAGQSSEQKTQSQSILSLTLKAFNAISFANRINTGDLVLVLVALLWLAGEVTK